MRGPEERPEAGLKPQGRVFGESHSLGGADGSGGLALGGGDSKGSSRARWGRGWGCGLAARGHRGWAAGEGGNRVVSPPHPTIQGHTESLRMTPSLE